MEETTQHKPTYNMAQNVGYMIRLAWHNHKSVLALCFVLALLHVAISLTELFLAPLVLGKVESAAPLRELFITIGAMAGTLAVLKTLPKLHKLKLTFGRTKLPG